MIFKLSRQYLIACLILVTAAWNLNLKTEANRPFDLAGTIKKYFALTIALLEPNKNLVCSPLSIYLLLGKLSLGAESPTIEELELAIGIFSKEEIKASYSKLISNLRRVRDGVTIHIAGQLFVNSKTIINDKYCNEVTEVFGSCLNPVNFSSPFEAANIINKWVSEQTKTLIPTIVTPGYLRLASSMIIVNAIYFSGNWKTPFKGVKPRIFHTVNGGRTVDMMFLKSDFNYVKSKVLQCHIVEIPYIGDEASFILVLPTQRGGLSMVMEEIQKNPHIFRAEMLKMEYESIHLKMPKFTIMASFELNDLLMELGLKTMFSKRDSGLIKMTDSDNVYLSKVIQKAFIEVTETGTTAAVITASVMTASLILSLEVEANHPFLFFIKSQSQQLFAGTYNGPDLNY